MIINRFDLEQMMAYITATISASLYAIYDVVDAF